MSTTFRYCKTCHAPRTGSSCWKCHEETTTPAEGWTFPALPDIAAIRAIAKTSGYAIGEHGSKEADLDLIAAPWTDTAVPATELLDRIATGINARVVVIEKKPVGRIAANLQIDGYYKIIDISVCPIIK